MTIDRRNFMIGTAAVAGASLVSNLVPFRGAVAASAKSGTQVPGFYRTKVGAIEVTSLLDGGMAFGDTLMSNTNEKDLASAKADSFLPAGNSFPGYVNGFVVNTGSKVTLIDTGAMGMAQSLGQLLPNLRAAGIQPTQVDEIILTHAHPDHTNGLLNADGSKAFPDAPVRIAEQELAFWFDDTKMAVYPDKKQLFEIARKNLGPYKASGQLQTYQANTDFGGGLSAVALYGHTPGHSGVRVSDGKDQLLIWGDIVHVPALQFTHPQASIAFDTDSTQARTTRAKIFDETATDRIRVGGMHLAFPAIGHLSRRGQGYDFVPQMWEASI